MEVPPPPLIFHTSLFGVGTIELKKKAQCEDTLVPELLVCLPHVEGNYQTTFDDGFPRTSSERVTNEATSGGRVGRVLVEYHLLSLIHSYS